MWKQLRRNYKRLVAFMLTIAMTFTNVGANLNVAFAAGESEDALFLVDAGALQQAIQDALEYGEIFDFSSLELKAKSSSLKTSYQKLLGTKSGHVYELDAEVDDSYTPDGTDLQVFYNAGTEDVVFLFVNESDCVVTFRANVSGYETSPITINPNTANVEDLNGAEAFVEDYSNTVMVDDEPKSLGAVVVPTETDQENDENTTVETDPGMMEAEMESEETAEDVWDLASPSDAQASISLHMVERVASSIASASDAEYATPSNAGERDDDFDDFDDEDGQMLIDDLNEDSDYAVHVYGDLKGKSFNTVTIWETANARAYRVAVKELQGLAGDMEIETQESYLVDYSVDPVGAAEIKGSRTIAAGGDLYFAVTPQIGYELIAVTANGKELEEVGEAALASASDLAGYEHIYVVNEVDEDLEIVASLEEIDGMRHPAFEESVTINGVTITASAEEGILPEGTVLSAEEVTAQVEDAVKEKLENEEGASVTTVIAYDINLMLNGKKLNNTWGEGSDNYVTVQFSGERIQELSKEAEQIQVAALETPTETVEAALGGTEEAAVVEDITAEDIEVDTEGREVIDVSGDAGVDAIAFDAKHFTVYVVIGSGKDSQTTLSQDAVANFYEVTSQEPISFGSKSGTANVTFTVSKSGEQATIELESGSTIYLTDDVYYKNSSGSYVKVSYFTVSSDGRGDKKTISVTAVLEDNSSVVYLNNASGNSKKNNTSSFYWVKGSTFSSAGTAEHIDIGLSLSATLKIGSETITESLTLTRSDITSGDFTVTATYGGETFTGFTVDKSNIETSSGASGITQYRVGGSYPVGTITTPVYYTVTLKKNVTFTTKDKTTYTVPMTFSSTFQYWDSDNDCPGLKSGGDKQDKPEGSEQESSYTKWQKGSFISGSGLDFLLGSSDYTQVKKGRIQITKNVTGYEVTEETYTFYIYDRTGTLVETLVVAVGADELGVSFSNLLEYGIYYIVEADAELTGHSVVTSYTGGTTVEYQNGKACRVEIDSSNKEIVITCTNGYTRESVNVEGSKTWTDSDNQDNLRPASITINLLADGVKVDSKTVTAADNWSWSFSDLDKYDADGKEIVYTITEDAVDGYTTTVNGYNVTNSHTPATTSVSGSKTWNDADNQDGKRPGSITINLLANGTKVDSQTVTADDNWTWTFADLDKYADGKEITYTISEDAVENYSSSVNGFDVTNTYTPETVSVSGAKDWDDANNQDGKRPTSIIIKLLADGEEIQSKTVTAADNWQWNFTNLPKYANGKEITYTISESEVSGYTTTVDGYNVKNSYTPETISISGSKTWKDSENQDGKRPGSITINLLADGVIVTSKSVSAADGWKWTFDNLAKYKAGKEIVYTISENAVNGYSTKVEGYDVTNSYTPETTSVSGSKTWDDAKNQDGIRPKSITINLLADGTEVAEKVVTAKDNWSWEFTGLDKFADGKEIEYTIAEATVAGYTTEINGYNVTNTHTPETTSVSGSKTWDDAENQDGKRPESITINLLANGEQVASKTVTVDDSWSWSFTNLDKYADGEEIEYTIAEVEVAGYTTEINGYNVTNSHTPEKTSVSGSKTWEDAENQDGKRPESITINLLANGEKIASKTVTEADDWTWSFTDLDKYADGKEIEYTIEEVEVAGYTTEINGYNVINTHTPETTSVSGSKTWDDEENQDGIRPASITINLLANGKQVASKTVTEADDWTWSFTDLEKYADGKEIEYTIAEVAVTGYTTKINGYNVTNSHTPEKTSVSGSKTWDDAKNQDGKRPESITINLLANGEQVVSKTVTADDNWTWSFTDLAKYADGKEIEYTIAEVAVTDYTTKINGYNVTNSYTPEKTSVSGSKTWDDEKNQDGKRPESITINLLANGEQVASKTVTEADSWTWSFTDLDKYADGKEIEYTIAEAEVAGYKTEIDGYNVTNTHTPETTSISGSKTWLDAENQDGKRPSSITIHLYANGTEVESKTVTAEDGWKWTFDNLDKYANGKEITYTISEDAVKNYSSSVNGYDVTNSYTPEIVSVSGAKNWNDNNDQDGKRPTSITIQLLADGKEIKSQTVTAANDWQWSFTNLPKYANGKEISYTISESKVAGYTTTVNGYNVTNSYTPETISISGSKDWKDNNNQDGKRPESITINLRADGEIVASKSVSAADGWQWTFDNLDKYKAGKEIVYTITEDDVADYTSSVSGYNVTNTHKPETIEISGTKTWNDNNNQDGKRPASITVRLLADGVEKMSQTVTADSDWTWKFTDQPKYKDGKEIVYTVIEDEVDGYTTKINGYDIVNTHEIETISISGSKTWVDGSNQNNTRPESITIRLLANGKEVQTTTAVAANNWAWAFTKLDRYKGGEEIKYTVTEDAVAGYSISINGMAVTNTLDDPEDVSVSGTKTWVDGGKTHDNEKEVIITLYRTSTQTGAAEEKLDAVPTWNGDTYMFSGLEKYDEDGYEYTYRVEETPITAYYSSQEGNNFTNTLRTGSFELKVAKELTGRTLEADQFTFAVTLDGEEVATAKNAADGTVTFEVPFPVYEGDKTYTYQIVEKDTELSGYEYDDQVVEVYVTVGIDADDAAKLVAAEIKYKESLLEKTGNFLKQLVGAGTDDVPTFTNKYTITSPANAAISGTKKVTGTDTENWHEGWFTFTMTPVADAAGTALDGAKAETVTNDGDSFSFDLTYDQDDLNVDGSWVTSRDFYYEITETEVHDAFTRDSQKFIVKVTVSDNGDGTMKASEPEVVSGGNEVVFTNAYKTVTHEFKLTGTKTLIGHELTAGQFDFEIIYPDGTKEIVTNGVENDVQAIEFQFGGLTADSYPYEPEFLIREIADPELEAQGYVFSKQQYKVTLTITDNGDGTYETELKSMELAVDADGAETGHAVDAIAFTNRYEVAGDVTFGGRKVLDGRAATDTDAFTFVLKKDGEAIDEVTVNLSENAEFQLKDAFDQDDIGKEFTYQISEKSAGQTIDGVTYDTTVYTGVYKIVDKENGTLSAEFVRGDMLENLTFTNVYKRGNASFTPAIEKHMSGRDFRGTDKYTFTVIQTAPDGEKRTEQVTIAPQSGKVYAAAFSTDVFGMDDIGKTYRYEIYEEKGDINKVTYDTTHYIVNVTITDDGKDNLTATAIVAGAEDTVFEKAVFTNVYKSGSGNNPGGGNGGGSDSGSDDGGSTSGGPGTTITPGDVPLSSLPSNGYVEIMEEEVPLGVLPKTGRANANANAIMLLISSLMMAAVAVTGRKKEEE